ncbi:unnamed protein product [Caenorhabditis sp. 36 PRJEB53466]|nr:unnamed protein product [Caenorhabditis sp. 36 PRJEB53466]
MKCLLVCLLVIAIVAKPQYQEAVRDGPKQLDDVCRDTGANCRNWALNGFCTNCHYTCQQRRDYCARTCGFCHSGYVCTNCTSTTTTTAAKKASVILL